jgi:FMN phosphatase YigB (HAD superfamily)
MILAFDLDGVLYNWHKAVYSYLTEQGKEIPSYNELWERFDKIFTADEICFLLSLPMLYDKMFPEKGLIEYLQSLSEKGHTIYYITSRRKELEITTELYLERFKFPQTRNLIFSADKDKYARLLEIDIFVEDQYKYTEKLKNVCKVIMRRQPWNIQYETEFDYIDVIPELDKYL